MRPGDMVAAIRTTTAREIARLAVGSGRPRGARVLAVTMAAATVLFVEIHLSAFGHGTHLLLFLVIAFGSGLLAGPGPATVVLVIGSVGAGAAALIGLGPADPAAKVVAQLSLYGLAGWVFVALLPVRLTPHSLEAQHEPPAANPAPRQVDPLTARELDVLRLAASGRTSQQIAEALIMSPNTVKTHLSHAYQKLAAQNRTDAVRAALHCGCLSAEDICPHRLAARAHDTSDG